MTKYLEQSIRDTQSVTPVRSKEILQFVQQGPSEVLDHSDSVLFPDAKLQEKVMSYTFTHGYGIQESEGREEVWCGEYRVGGLGCYRKGRGNGS